MKDELLKFFAFEKHTDIEFREICGFTFVFKKNILIFEERGVSAEIKPIAIIYEENDEFYLAPLDKVSDIDAIVEKYVENCM
jgi:hypothetical protein